MNATLHGGPFDGDVSPYVSRATLLCLEQRWNPTTHHPEIWEHTYHATDPTRTVYRWVSERLLLEHVGDLNG